MDFAFYIQPVTQVLGKVLWQLVSIEENTTQLKQTDRKVTFNVAPEVQDNQKEYYGV